MTRRERHIRIFEWFDDRQRRHALAGLIAREGLDAFTDEAIEKLARSILADWQFSQKLNARNREIARAS